MWFQLNENTRISAITPVGESEIQIITNILGQGGFGATRTIFNGIKPDQEIILALLETRLGS